MFVNEQDKFLQPGVYCDGVHIVIHPSDDSTRLLPKGE